MNSHRNNSPLIYSTDRAAILTTMSSMYGSLTYRDLQAAAKAQGMKANGSKAELLERLLEATPAAEAAPEVDIEAPASPDKTAKTMNSHEDLTVKDLAPIRSVKKSAKKSAVKAPPAPAEEEAEEVVVEAPAVVVEKAATPVKAKAATPKKSAKKSALKPKTPNPFTKIVTGKTPKANAAAAAAASSAALFPPAAPTPASENTTAAPKPMVAVEAWMTAKTPKIKAKAAPAAPAPAPAPVVKPTTLDLTSLASEASDEIDAIFNASNAKPHKKATNTPKKTPANTPAKSKAGTAATPLSKKQAKQAPVEEWANDETEEPFVAGTWGAEDDGDYYDEDNEASSANSASTALFTSPMGSRMPQFNGVKVYLSSPLGSPKPVNKWTYEDFGSPNSKHTAESDAAAAKAAAKAARKAEKRAAKKAAEKAATSGASTSSPASTKAKLAGAPSPMRTVFGNVTNA